MFDNKVKLNTTILPVVAMLSPLSVAEESEGKDGKSVMEEIVVTVERREQSLQDYAGTAAQISGEDLKQLGVATIEDIDASIPGLSISNNQGNIEVYIRGIGSSNNTELGDPAAATHLDGVYIPRPAGIGASFFDIQRVEVNVGPQGTLRGRNATAGTVNIIPWSPGIGNTDGAVDLSFGNFGEQRLEGVANIALTDNSALRVAGFVSEHDSYYSNISPTSDELGLDVPVAESEGIGVAEAADDEGVRISYLYKPTDQWDMQLTYDRVEQKGTGYTGSNYANLLGNGIDPDSISNPRAVFGRAFTPEEDTSHWGLKGRVKYSADNFDVEYTVSRRHLIYDYEFGGAALSPFYPGALDTLRNDTPPIGATPFSETFDNFARVKFITDSESDIHELRFSGDGIGSAKGYWSAGVFYFEESQRTFLGATADRNAFFAGNEFNQTTDTESISYYTDATWEISEKVRLTGGLRYTSDEKQRFGVNARYVFFQGVEGFQLGASAFGTEGFEFNGFDRTIFNPDTDGDGLVTSNESIDFFLDGVRTFGARDGLGDILANGEVPGGGGGDVTNLPLCPDLLVSATGCPTAGGFVDGIFAGNADRLSFIVPGNDIALQNGRVENEFVDWRIRLEMDVFEDSLLYGLVATGHKSGGFNDNLSGTEGVVTPNPAGGAPRAFDTDTLAPTYDEEKVTLYEVGLKNAFTLGDIPATFNATAFYYDYKDLQLNTLVSSLQILNFEGFDVSMLSDAELEALGGNVVNFTFNASNAEIKGAQFEGGFDFPGEWNFRYNLLYIDTEVKDSVEVSDSRFQADVSPLDAVNVSIEGNELPRTPNLQFNASLSKAYVTNYGQFDGVLSAGYRSDQHLTIFNGIDFRFPDDPRGRLDDEIEGYWTLDFGLGFSYGFDNKYRAELYVNNVTDEQKEQAIIITEFDNTRFFSRPRTYGLRFRALF
ncbi:TonB-dependent receptor [Porticoccus sp. W117]|uniref:TonB-dependent receptor n=1 Tax=Porticoccus sp. W117 TaxID=3054777 RepID=UPI00259A4AAB|nr:TonB-dependent receptor plug domain-containing protein [Porticoccus sp. W117]MDM3870033.1 TonB-dependent receptor [Porticoccus sp. W117]